MNFKILKLWQLKQNLIGSWKKLSVVKCHKDIALPEHTHIADKVIFQRTNKHLSTTNAEMLENISIQLRSETIKQYKLIFKNCISDLFDDFMTYLGSTNS